MAVLGGMAPHNKPHEIKPYTYEVPEPSKPKEKKRDPLAHMLNHQPPMEYFCPDCGVRFQMDNVYNGTLPCGHKQDGRNPVIPIIRTRCSDDPNSDNYTINLALPDGVTAEIRDGQLHITGPTRAMFNIYEAIADVTLRSYKVRKTAVDTIEWTDRS